jgi:hypothetical protein
MFNRYAIALAACLASAPLSGCAGLNIQWALTATYNTPATTTATLTPGAIVPAVTTLVTTQPK